MEGTCPIFVVRITILVPAAEAGQGRSRHAWPELLTDIGGRPEEICWLPPLDRLPFDRLASGAGG